MKISFRKFDDTYYHRVCDFFIELSQDNLIHINWNWARWEWMFYHPDFNNNLVDKIGLWFCDEELIGVATYDHYLGEGFFGVKSGFERLEKEMLEYSIETFSDENGIGIAVNNTDTSSLNLLQSYGFSKCEETENILELTLEDMDFNLTPIKGIELKNINIENDLYKHHELLWKGFNHEGQAPLHEETINKQKRMLSAPHLNSLLHVIAKNERDEYVAYCGLWYSEKTDYVYVEPICTIPEYRNRGIAKLVLMEGLKRAYNLGAKKAYVISDSDFYKSIGFKQHSHYTFYWHRN
ncbi:GNAT family N-acetyltransferase [Clostridium sp. LIBA-8841]|uniref:GNAT family N-acetyltransferase n=1 Tax=Clostridium sp. LIBA-8841 TaxID=2987530 RepID=UPI002AC4A8FC|nr:GNAT family N-acetyltransferase [Clostridium sp. LIBA-8841]MDZ5252737.1 GNAT family N-acetyltransferase [Clostridium sp. LIBA-8841]